MPGCRHSDMPRYFMSASEAVSIIIQAAALTGTTDFTDYTLSPCHPFSPSPCLPLKTVVDTLTLRGR